MNSKSNNVYLYHHFWADFYGQESLTSPQNADHVSHLQFSSSFPPAGLLHTTAGLLHSTDLFNDCFSLLLPHQINVLLLLWFSSFPLAYLTYLTSSAVYTVSVLLTVTMDTQFFCYPISPGWFRTEVQPTPLLQHKFASQLKSRDITMETALDPHHTSLQNKIMVYFSSSNVSDI